jgi:hypothetical protein
VIVVGFVILAWLLVGCVLLYLDVCAECRYQTAAAEHDELLNELWGGE